MDFISWSGLNSDQILVGYSYDICAIIAPVYCVGKSVTIAYCLTFIIHSNGFHKDVFVALCHALLLYWSHTLFFPLLSPAVLIHPLSFTSIYTNDFLHPYKVLDLQMKENTQYLSESDLFCLVWPSWVASIFLQMTFFHSFLLPNRASHFFTHSSVDGHLGWF